MRDTWAVFVVAGVVEGAAGCSATPSAAGSGDVVMPAPVRIIRGDPAITTWLTLTIDGHGLTALEGRLVRLRIGTPEYPNERLGAAVARVENGAFSVTFPNVWEPGGTYKRKMVFIEAPARPQSARSGTCPGPTPERAPTERGVSRAQDQPPA